MRRPWQTWALFGVGVALVLAAMGWVSAKVIELDRAQAEARAQAEVEERTRLALWRLDAVLSPLVSEEAAQPYFTYRAFYPAERPYARMFGPIRDGEVLLPSPLLTQRAEHVLLHFQLGPEGELTSPQVPTGDMRRLALERFLEAPALAAATERLARLQAAELRTALDAALPAGTSAGAVEPVRLAAVVPSNDDYEQQQAAAPPQLAQQLRNTIEWNVRSANYGNASLQAKSYNPLAAGNLVGSGQARGVVGLGLGGGGAGDGTGEAEGDAKGGEGAVDLHEGPLRPVWSADRLVLARRVRADEREWLQGVLVDWPALQAALLGAVQDLLPQARLERLPSTAAAPEEQSRRLASLPLRLVPGDIVAASVSGPSPLTLSLAVAWLCVLLGAVAVGLLLRGAVTLSERRGAFVSAVTHELRTPLTTFRMYTEMLADGMVDEARRDRYVRTLQAEAERLGHLVENVLAYARLERNRHGGHVEVLPVAEVVARAQEHLAGRAAQAEMTLVVDIDAAAEAEIRVDAAAIERILFNLVDNACKYAASAEDRRIHVEAEGPRGGKVTLRVRDHGPGVDPRDARRLFRPFSKSAKEAAQSAPGVGLGLALGLRLARAMGGDLRVEESAAGARFALSLPTA